MILVFSVNMVAQEFNKQNTYVDALELKKIFDQNRLYVNVENNQLYDDYHEILNKYGINQGNINSNIFLRDSTLKRNVNEREGWGATNTITLSDSRPKLEAISANPLNWQASAINGIANFMVGRFKQEVLQVAIDQVFKQIKTKEDSILVKSLFPKTFKQIGDLYGSGASSYFTGDLLLLRQTAQIDIEKLPRNIINNLNTIFPKLNTEPEIKDMLVFGNYVVEHSQQGQSLDRLLSGLANETYSSDATVSNILNLADLLSQALLNKEGSNEIWVNPTQILPTTATSMKNLEIRYFYGLLYHQLNQIPELEEYLEIEDSNDLASTAAKIQDLVMFVTKLNNTYNYIKSKDFNLKSTEEIFTYIKDINQTLLFFTSTLKKIPETNKYYKINDNILDVSSRFIAIVEASVQKDYQKVIPLLIIEFGEYMMDGNVKSSRTIAFVSQLATTQNADDMEALLRSFALPIGSSSIKRRSSFNLSVNGYVGLTGGLETAYISPKNQTKGNIGLSAPIGLSATFCKGYLTSFVSFLDLGSIVNQRLNNDRTTYTNFKFEHFFIPGLGLYLNLPKLPISMGIHFNYIPNFRTITYESGNAIITETNQSVTRANFSVLVDIPFFTVYNKGKK